MNNETFNINEIMNLIKSSHWEDLKLAEIIIDKMDIIPEDLRNSFYQYYIPFSSKDEKVIYALQEIQKKFK